MHKVGVLVAVLRVMVVDNHPLIRLGLRAVLSAAEDIHIIAELDGGSDAVRQIGELKPDVVVLDISMPDTHGIDVLRGLAREELTSPVLVYTRYPEEQYAIRTLRAGAAGYLNKSCHPQELVTAIRTVARGDVYTSPRVAALLRNEISKPRGDLKRHDQLSDREFEVMRMILAGKSLTQVANELDLNVKTVSTHRTRLLRKLDLGSTAELVRYAIEHGIDDPTPSASR